MADTNIADYPIVQKLLDYSLPPATAAQQKDVSEKMCRKNDKKKHPAIRYRDKRVIFKRDHGKKWNMLPAVL